MKWIDEWGNETWPDTPTARRNVKRAVTLPDGLALIEAVANRLTDAKDRDDLQDAAAQVRIAIRALREEFTVAAIRKLVGV